MENAPARARLEGHLSTAAIAQLQEVTTHALRLQLLNAPGCVAYKHASHVQSATVYLAHHVSLRILLGSHPHIFIVRTTPTAALAGADLKSPDDLYTYRQSREVPLVRQDSLASTNSGGGPWRFSVRWSTLTVIRSRGVPMADYDVQYDKDKENWGAKREGAGRAAARFDTQAEAHAAARALVENSGGGEVRDHRKDNNQIRNTDTIGKKDPNPPRG
jgi:Uncharacterized protein conserved in bacteria (DUF2188)